MPSWNLEEETIGTSWFKKRLEGGDLLVPRRVDACEIYDLTKSRNYFASISILDVDAQKKPIRSIHVYWMPYFLSLHNIVVVLSPKKPTPFFVSSVLFHVLTIAILYILTILLFPKFCLFQIPLKCTSPDFHLKTTNPSPLPNKKTMNSEV